MKSGPVQFFPTREVLHRADGTLGASFEKVTSVSALLVLGREFYNAGHRTEVIKRLLLPNPDSESFKTYESTQSEKNLGQIVRDITARAKALHAKVRWYDTFIFHTIILADIEHPNGWAHVESVLPYSRSSHRMSYRLSRKHSESAVMELSRVYGQIWDTAKDAP